MEQTIKYPCYMKADRRAQTNTIYDISPLLGDWVNVKTDSNYLVRAILTEKSDRNQSDRRLILRSYGANDPEPIDWGEVEAIPYLAGTASIANGFHALYNLDGIEVHLVANYKLGILVIASYVRYLDGSNRTSHVAREFFRR
jgi:hypothetical protein